MGGIFSVLIWVIVILFIVLINGVSSKSRKAKRPVQRPAVHNQQVRPNQPVYTQPARQSQPVYTQQARQNQPSAVNNIPAAAQKKSTAMTPEQRKQLEAYRAAKNLNADRAGQVSVRGADPQDTDILARANRNTKRYSEDLTEIQSSLLGDLSDLMVKGYDGKLSFERDFLGEAMDMINSFTLPS